MRTRHRLYVAGFFLLLAVAPIAYQIDRAAQSLPTLDGDFPLAGLTQRVRVEFDSLAVPTVHATSREDAYRALGYLHARDRLFQMDLQRRKSAGRLAEIWGEKALDLDRGQRHYRLAEATAATLAHLSPDERAILSAYAEGVNAVISSAREFPPEFRLLHYRPEPWQPTDSLLVAATMFQTLTDQEADERMLTIMQACLPESVTAFLTPDTDDYLRTLAGGSASWRPVRPVPVDDIARLIAEAQESTPDQAWVEPEATNLGSNNWAVSGSKTADGRAIIANDMHLSLGVPNIWYRAHLRYMGRQLSGVTLPGLPLVVVGSNGHVAWGFTNLNGDVQDLVRLELKPDDSHQYRTATGWRAFEDKAETILVRDAAPVHLSQRGTIWGPVLQNELLGSPVALHWSALDSGAVNLRLLDMDGAATLQEAMHTLNRFGAPPQNAVIADERGHIGWTLTGFLPRRRGLDGSVAEYWSSGDKGWDGYLEPDQLPRLIDPPEGFIATANQRVTGKEGVPMIGHNFAHGYRAFRIRQRLAEQPRLSEADLAAIQLDTVSEFYEFYRELALSVLSTQSSLAEPDLAEIDSVVREWDGRLAPGSVGIALLLSWRAAMAKAIFTPLLRRCHEIDPAFTYQWREMEIPLRALLQQGVPGLPRQKSQDWGDFLLTTLHQAALELKREQGMKDLRQITWGRVNTIRIQHPFSRAASWASGFLDMPELAGACNSNCVKVLYDRSGASERLVVSPNHMEDGLLEMPGGQSGHPLSSHFRDQQATWASDHMQPFLPGQPLHRLVLNPTLAPVKP